MMSRILRQMAEIAKKFLITTETVEIIRIRSNWGCGEHIRYADKPDEIHLSELDLKEDGSMTGNCQRMEIDLFAK